MDTVRIGILAPLSPPGWVEAGRHLLAGLELGGRDVDDAGGIRGRRVELVVRDTAADPRRAAAAVDELHGLGVAALAGEYHSVVARAAAARAEALGLPFLCSSAVIDALTDEPAEWVARIAPVQSRGWSLYADFLRGAGHERIAVVAADSVYWASGIRILRERLTVVELDGPEQLEASGASALLLLVGHPEPTLSIVRSVGNGTLLGAPAGQPELAAEAAGVPFLRYLPPRLGPLGARVEAALRQELGRAPSFVAFEGYDTLVALAEALRSEPFSWERVTVEGTRGRIAFSRTPESSVWQWAWPPIHVADRDPERPDRFRVLHAAA